MDKINFSKTNGKAILGVIVTVASLITTVDNLISGNKQAKKIEKIDDLEKRLSQLENK